MSAIHIRTVFYSFTYAIILIFHSPSFADNDAITAIAQKSLKLFNAGRYAEGLPIEKKRLKLTKQKYGRESQGYIEALYNLGGYYRALKQYPAAEQNYMQAFKLAIKMKYYYRAGTTLNNLAITYERWQRFEKAEVFHQKAIALKRDKLKHPSPSLAISLLNLAKFLEQRHKKPATSEKYYLEAISVLKASQYNKQVLNVSHNLVEFYKRHNRFADAENHLWTMVKFLQKLNADVLIGMRLNNIALLRKLQGDPNEELKLKLQALAIFEKKLKPDHILITNSLHNLWTFYLSHNKQKEAAYYRKRLDKIRGN